MSEAFVMPSDVPTLQLELSAWRTRALAAEAALQRLRAERRNHHDEDDDDDERTDLDHHDGDDDVALKQRTDAVVSLSRSLQRLSSIQRGLTVVPDAAFASNDNKDGVASPGASPSKAFKAAAAPLSSARRTAFLMGSGRQRTDSVGPSSSPSSAAAAPVAPVSGGVSSVSQQELRALRRRSVEVALGRIAEEDESSSSLLSSSDSADLATVAKRDRSNTIVFENETEKVVWFKDEASGIVEVKAGALAPLVDLLTPDRSTPDSTFIKEFLYSFRAFCEPRDLLLLLVTRWLYMPVGALADLSPRERVQLRPVVQMRVINVIKRWIEAHAVDFAEPTIAEELHRFLRVSVAEDKGMTRWSPVLLALFHARVAPDVAAPLLDWSLPIEALVAALARRDSGVRRVQTDIGTHFLASDAVKWLAANVGKDADDAAALAAALACLQRMAAARLIAPLDRAELPAVADDERAFSFTDDSSLNEASAALLKAPKSLFEAGADGDGDAFEFDELEPLEVARQLTLIDRDLFTAIEPTLIHMSKLDQMTEALSRYVAHFNRVSFWVAGEIVQPIDVATRVRRLRLIVQVCEHLERLRDYNSLFAATAALHNASVNRLKLTWAGVGPGTHERAALERLLELTRPNNNYAAYRQQLQVDSSGQLPCIPYFGLYLKDLLHIEDGNDSVVKSAPTGTQLINFEKFRMLASVLEKIHTFQGLAKRYALRAVPQIQDYILAFDLKDDKELYRLSLLREPRVAAAADAAAAIAAAGVAPGSPSLARKGNFLSRLRSKRLSGTGEQLGLTPGASIEQVVRRRTSTEHETSIHEAEPAIVIVKSQSTKGKKK